MVGILGVWVFEAKEHLQTSAPSILGLSQEVISYPEAEPVAKAVLPPELAQPGAQGVISHYLLSYPGA